MILVRCPKCGFGWRVKELTTITVCPECGETITLRMIMGGEV